jgi:HD-GYP domain-containing protein (c-di-GMP phosphodiesterase class II)
MEKFLNKFRLLVKLNITTAISALTIIIATIMFYITTDIIFQIIEKNNQSKTETQKASNTINTTLHKIDYITIYNSINAQKDFASKRQALYQTLLQNILAVKESNYLHNDPEAQAIIKKISIRIEGYKIIANSLQSEVQEDSTDGLYTILGLSAASQKILYELETLNQKIDAVSQKRIEDLNQNILYIKSISITFVTLLFLFLMYTNKLILSSILQRIERLKEELLTFFDLLAKKRDDAIHITQDGNDEITEISKIIDDNIFIAEDIIKQERADTKLIEEKVHEATKEIRALNSEIEATQREVVFTMGSIAEERSKETGHHVKRVAEYSLILARLYGLSLEESLLIKNASPMHDIGKIAIPDAILNKPGRFTPEEFEVMKSHSEIGYKMLRHSERSILKAASILAYEHHERWDGKGYPQGLKGEEIHIYGRITAIADVFDALGSDRVYKEAWPLSKILALFEEEKGKQFDPELMELFLDNLEHFLAAKEMIEGSSDESNVLSKYIENFEKVPNYLEV